jgi:hypothetical protein
MPRRRISARATTGPASTRNADDATWSANSNTSPASTPCPLTGPRTSTLFPAAMASDTSGAACSGLSATARSSKNAVTAAGEKRFSFLRDMLPQGLLPRPSDHDRNSPSYRGKLNPRRYFMHDRDIAGGPRPGLPRTRNGRDEGRAPGVQNDGVPCGEPSRAAVRTYHNHGPFTVQTSPARHEGLWI